MSTPTTTETDARAASRERLRTVVAATLADVHDRTLNLTDAEETIMAAAQQWAMEGYMISTAPAAKPCPKSGGTVDRWHEGTNLLFAPDDDKPDPGPYTEGEHVTCPGCGADVPVTPVANNLRSAGRQYVARLPQHTIPTP
ncbi:hypothetical protein [Streptomyces sp. MH60]|uniref:hypothetical protein n=1 Tax=Streptomyces sp. MH60 TaxID=1940758 RepID=UPI000CEF50C8|nr:hypothetical protein [Streptomyces sp. MH60]PPS89601.1 hypothetical protein BZZ08_01748 [Streptomyces sp. MH60]